MCSVGRHYLFRPQEQGGRMKRLWAWADDYAKSELFRPRNGAAEWTATLCFDKRAILPDSSVPGNRGGQFNCPHGEPDPPAGAHSRPRNRAASVKQPALLPCRSSSVATLPSERGQPN